jgi:hypothetical protein
VKFADESTVHSALGSPKIEIPSPQGLGRIHIVEVDIGVTTIFRLGNKYQTSLRHGRPTKIVPIPTTKKKAADQAKRSSGETSEFYEEITSARYFIPIQPHSSLTLLHGRFSAKLAR